MFHLIKELLAPTDSEYTTPFTLIGKKMDFNICVGYWEFLLPYQTHNVNKKVLILSYLVIRHSKAAGDSSMLPLASTYRTIKTCFPSGKLGKINGLVQVTNPEPSMLHSKRSTASALLEKSNLMVFEGVLVPLIIILLLPSIIEVITVSAGPVIPDGVPVTLFTGLLVLAVP